MKPHEETWRCQGDRVFADDGGDTGYVRAAAYFAGGKNSSAVAAARLISAAPEMARELLKLLVRDDGHLVSCAAASRVRTYCTDPHCADIRKTLIKAGVIS